MKKTIGMMLLVFLMTSCLESEEANNVISPVSLINKIDHIVLVPEKPTELYDLLLTKFQLPLAWRYQAYKGFSSGGFHLGNVNLEVGWSKSNSVFGIKGLAFEPSMKTEDIVEHLKERRITYKGPYSYDTYWTNLYISDLVDGNSVFFFEYHVERDTSYKYPGGLLEY